MTKSDERIKTLEMIAEDMKNDARDFDGRPFDGKTVAQYFGNHGAAIAALAKIMKAMQHEIDDKSNDKADGLRASSNTVRPMVGKETKCMD